jgi:stringent starvation protein B
MDGSRKSAMSEPSTKPYLIRAIYEWCTDSGYTPFLAVHVDATTRVPQEFVKNNEIVLNISALATSKLSIGNELVEFQARFGGKARTISVPIVNVSAIYARENGHGMAFDLGDPAIARGHEPPALPAPEVPVEVEAERETGARELLKVVHPEEQPQPPPDGPKGRPHLTIVK